MSICDRIIILRGALAPSADRRTEDRGFWVCPNSEMGRALRQLEGVAPTCVPCPICRRSNKGVPARTERGPSSERMGETREGNLE
jgi:hypothetical protein